MRDDNNAVNAASGDDRAHEPEPPAATPATSSPSGKRPRGKPIHVVWALFTDKRDAHRLASGDTAMCKHCNYSVRHHNKVVSVMTHLRKCQAFARVVKEQMDDADVPEWYTVKRMRYNKRASKKEPNVSSNPVTGAIAHVVPIRMEKKVKQQQQAPPLTQLASPLKLQAPGPSPAKTSLPVVKSSIAELLASSPFVSVAAVYNELSSAVSSSRISYYVAAVGATPLLLEAAEDIDDPEDQQWIAQDMARVIDMLGVRTLCGAITNSNSLAHQNARKLLKQTFSTCFFHGCATQSLQVLVKSVCGPLGTPHEQRQAVVINDGAFLSSFTSDCQRVVEFFFNTEDCDNATTQELLNYQANNQVAALKPFESSYRTSISSLVTFFHALRENAYILHQIVSESSFISSGSADAKACKLTIRAIVSKDGRFEASLDKAIAILEPISALDVKLRSPAAAPSDVYQGFTALPELLGAIPTLTPKEKGYVVAMSRGCFDAMSGDALALANLLDPRFLGDGMSRDTQAAVEDLLFNFSSVDAAIDDDEEALEARQEAIYAQYTEFRVASLAERSKNTFRFKMLLKGRKSALQFWQSDATFWPELQAIALRVFSMAVSASTSC